MRLFISFNFDDEITDELVRLQRQLKDGDTVYSEEEILSTELKKKAGFGKEGEKNYPGIITGVQMQFYLVTAGFRRRVNKKGG